MTDHFDQYYEEFSTALKQLAMAQPEKAQGWADQCRDALQLAAVEARNVTDLSLKQELLAAVKDGKIQVDSLMQVHEKGELLSPVRQMQNNEELLARQNDRLERAQRTLEETEYIGMEISGQLGENRDKLQSTRKKVDEMQSLTGRAGELMKSITKPWWWR